MDRNENSISAMLHDVIVASTEELSDASLSALDECNDARENPHPGIKVLFLSSDTGGGHRASAESLGRQFQILFPGSTYELLDIVEKDGVPPYNSLVSWYKHLSGQPSQWKLVYSVSNSRAFELLADTHLKLMCERAVRRRILSYAPDVVVSVHPLMTNVPVLSCSKISKETGMHLPMFTVVTDLGSAHCLWFANGVEKMFVGSERIKELAKVRGKVPEEKLVLSGLPIRNEFAVQSEALGDRMSEDGKAYQQNTRQQLGLPCTDRKTVLLMGGGEGVGSLSNITDALYSELVSQGIDALVIVVCGRNDKLKNSLASRNWNDVIKRWKDKDRFYKENTLMSFSETCVPGIRTSAGCLETGKVTGSIRKMLAKGTKTVGNAMTVPLPTSKEDEEAAAEEEKKAEMNDAAAQYSSCILEESIPAVDNSQSFVHSLAEERSADVTVVGLGFVANIAEYMVAADILVSKAGPGTISEAAALSLPIMLTSYLPGQEEGNVDYVVEAGFGAYVHDSDPIGIAEEICMWLTDDEKRARLSRAAKRMGAPNAARDIANAIGESTLKWMESNKSKKNAVSKK